MSFWTYHKKLHPLVAVFFSLAIGITGLVLAKTWSVSIFLGACAILLCICGCGRAVIRTIIPCAIVSGIFFGIMYGSHGDVAFGVTMVNRIVALFLAVVPGMSTEPVRLTRALSQIHMPRAVTLGALITFSFVPLLKVETHRVREAMKTRGAGSILNPVIFYRAFLFPFVMRLINMSDTLALSVETRGYTLGKDPYTIYNAEKFVVSDLVYMLILIVGIVLVSVFQAIFNTDLVRL